MLYREAAVRISQTVMMTARELEESTGQMIHYQKEGKVTEEQAGTHLHKVNVILEILYTELLDPVIAEYPDLGSRCSICERCEEGSENSSE
ncbi:hypothetical protein [Pantoea anthophila]|uniref:hypothetical protein n=1 Tax=Pantoea anthophila TaxID=470931 RepID=UPI003CE744E0